MTKAQMMDRIEALEGRIAGMSVASYRMKRMTAKERSDVARLGGFASGKVRRANARKRKAA